MMTSSGIDVGDAGRAGSIPRRSDRSGHSCSPSPALARRRRRGGEPRPAQGRCRPTTSPTASQKTARAYHFGSQGPGDVFSNHTSHSNRLVPVYVFGRKADLGAVTGENSRYRDPEKIKATLRLPAREHGQPRRRLRRPERPLPGAEGGRRAGGQAPVHRLVRRPGLADHAGRGDRQDGQGLHRGQGLGADLPGLRRRRLGAVRLRRHQPDARQEHARRRRPDGRRSRRTASAAATTRGSPARTPGRSARSARPPATSRASRPTRPTGRACRPSAASCTPTPTRRRAPPR